MNGFSVVIIIILLVVLIMQEHAILSLLHKRDKNEKKQREELIKALEIQTEVLHKFVRLVENQIGAEEFFGTDSPANISDWIGMLYKRLQQRGDVIIQRDRIPMFLRFVETPGYYWETDPDYDGEPGMVRLVLNREDLTNISNGRKMYEPSGSPRRNRTR